ncbi:winged helix-turn-helix domain-containing protein [Halalkalibacter nanhaiisediminis]|uniref:GntR family transcriptional regulator of abcA and norABC n=1 Tax=Halalkalibacter nanhaiisediminis TaxID=688079 RepID=A0A562QTU4_9BACI|nr:winged helix-turn-helix domain-containing protein [Halalkalibacter nanhaiisediminis]TWI60033.1 GntR family transcriptional regulator of abcA and norABC [Halalkalibacter nanhaiisediminis]
MINYHLIVLDIKEKITSGEWPPYLKIPTQNELSKKYNVNRSTIVKAIDELKSLGYLKGIQGSGTFVSSEIIDLRLKQATIEWENISKWSFFSSDKKLVRKINDLETNSNNSIRFSFVFEGKENFRKRSKYLSEAYSKFSV